MTTPTNTTASGSLPPPPSTRLERYVRHGLTILRRAGRPKFKCRIRFQNQVHHLTLCDTVEESFKAALLARREIHAGRWEQFRAATGLRPPEKYATLEEIRAAYVNYPGARGLKPFTKQCNLQALDRFLRTASAATINPQSSTSLLTSALVAHWKWLKRELADQQPDPEDTRRVLRSARSELTMARSIFCPDAQSYYTQRCALNLPTSLKAFIEEPSFQNVAKDEYHAPSAAIITATFAAVEQLVTRHPSPADVPLLDRNVHVSFWLAVGFGLRASEITRCQVKDFQVETDASGAATDVIFRPDWRAKNKKIPDIGVQLDAWPRLAPHITGAPEDFVLQGNLTERKTDVFRRISALFQQLGWKTTHHIHEMRAWAGCQIALSHPQGMLAAQAFLRHSHINTTQQFYGHHIKLRLEKVALPAFAAPVGRTQIVQPAVFTAPANRVSATDSEPQRIHFGDS